MFTYMSSSGANNFSKRIKIGRTQSTSKFISMHELIYERHEICHFITDYFTKIADFKSRDIDATSRESDSGEVFIEIKEQDNLILHVSFHVGKTKKYNIGSIHFKWEDYEDVPNYRYYNLLMYNKTDDKFVLGPRYSGHLLNRYRDRFNTNRIWYDTEEGKLITNDNFDLDRNRIEKIILRCLNEFRFVMDADEFNNNYRDMGPIIDRDRDLDKDDNKSSKKYLLKYLKYKDKYLKLKKLIQLD
jgi:hypothetical protein